MVRITERSDRRIGLQPCCYMQLGTTLSCRGVRLRLIKQFKTTIQMCQDIDKHNATCLPSWLCKQQKRTPISVKHGRYVGMVVKGFLTVTVLFLLIKNLQMYSGVA